MVLTKTQVSELYVSIFNRASEKSGSQNWLNSGYNTDATAMANAMLADDAAIEYFGTSLLTDKAFVDHIYKNTLNKGEGVDEAGKAVWVEFLQTGATRGAMVVKMIEAIAEYAPDGTKYDPTDTVTVAAYNQFTNRVKVSDYTAETLETIAVSEIDSTLSFGGALIVTADTKTVTTAKAAIDAINPANVGETFTLTTSTIGDTFIGTEKNDLFNATTLNSLQNKDVLLDSTTTDSDILNAAVTTDSVNARIQNIETINVTGEYIKTGLVLTNVSGAKTLNLDTKLAGGTATVTDANSINAAAIKAGANISTLNVTSLTSGTRDTVTVDAGSASTLNLTGALAGADSYNATVAADTTVTLTNLNSAGDNVTLNVAGDIDLTSANSNELDITINATEDSVVELQNNASVNAEKIFITGTKDVTLSVTDGKALAGAAGTGTIIADNSTGTSTIKVTGSLTTAVLSEAAVDVVEVAAAVTGAAALTLNNNTKLNLSANAAGTSLTVGLDDNDDNTTFTTGTLRVDVSQAQSKIIATNQFVDTVIVTATPDKVTDLDQDENGTNETSMTINDLQLVEETDVVMVQGAENLVLSNFTVTKAALLADPAAEYVLSAASMTGDLTVSSVVINPAVGPQGTVGKVTIVGGAGNDNITTNVANKFDIQSGAGNDTINIGTHDGKTAAAADTKVSAGAGNDTVYSTSATATIDLGAGDDTVIAAGNDTITLGAGADKVELSRVASTAGSILVKDFVKGEDTVVLTTGTMAATKAINFSNVAVASGVYTIEDAADYKLQLQNAGSNLSATDMRDSFQAKNVTLANGTTNILGDKDDSVVVAAGESATITTGAGSDTVTIAAGAATKATIKDFTVGTDKIVLNGAITTDLSVNLSNVTPTTGVYTIGDATKGHSFDIETGGSDIVTENNLTSIVQLGTSATSTFDTESTAGKKVAVVGGTFNDFVSLKSADTAGATYTFSNNGGVDFVKLATGTGEELVNFNNLNGIDSTVAKVGITANQAKIADATNKGVYVFADSSDGAGSAKITTFVEDLNNGYTQAVIDDEVAAFINAGLGVSAGEKYVVVINDTSSGAYDSTAYGTGAKVYDSYAYLVTGDNDGVQADNIQLIGMIEDDGVAAVVTIADIA